MSLMAGLRRFAKTVEDNLDLIVAGTVEDAGERVVELSPVGDPTIWENPGAAPVGYVGGEFASNWFYSANAPSSEFRPGVTNIRTVNNLDAMPAKAAGLKHFIGNADPKGPSLEYGHSSQAPAGVIGVTAVELPEICYAVARRVAAR